MSRAPGTLTSSSTSDRLPRLPLGSGRPGRGRCVAAPGSGRGADARRCGRPAGCRSRRGRVSSHRPPSLRREQRGDSGGHREPRASRHRPPDDAAGRAHRRARPAGRVAAHQVARRRRRGAPDRRRDLRGHPPQPLDREHDRRVELGLSRRGARSAPAAAGGTVQVRQSGTAYTTANISAEVTKQLAQPGGTVAAATPQAASDAKTHAAHAGRSEGLPGRPPGAGRGAQRSWTSRPTTASRPQSSCSRTRDGTRDIWVVAPTCAPNADGTMLFKKLG